MFKKILIIVLIGFGIITFAKAENFGAFGDPFISIQLANNPLSGQILQTNGTNNSWINVSSIGDGASSWQEIWPNTLAPTNTSAGIYVNASSTFNSTLTVNTSLDLTGSITNYFGVACGAGNYVSDIADDGTFSCSVPADTSYPGQMGSWQTLWTNVLAPTNTSAGFFSYASSTVNSNFRVNGAATTTGTQQADDVYIPNMSLTDTTYRSVNDFFKMITSAGRTTGGAITDNGDGTVNVAAGTGLLRLADDDVSQVKFINWSASSTIDVPPTSTLFFGVEYNSGSPRLVSKATETWNLDTEFPIGRVVKFNGDVHLSNNPWWVGDGLTNVIERFESEGEVTRDDKVGGLILGTSGQYVTLTAGTLWSRLTEFDITAKDTNGSGATMELFYRDGATGWLRASSTARIWPNTQYDDNSGTLQTMNNNYYSVLWVYTDVEGDLYILYGQAEYNSAAGADAATAPSAVPDVIANHGLLVGRIVFQKSAVVAKATESAFNVAFVSSLAADHGNLTGLADDDHSQYLLATGARNVSGEMIYNTGLRSVYVNSTTTNVGTLNVFTALSFPADSVAEEDIDFNTACAAGSHLYVNGNDLACETDDDTYTSNWQALWTNTLAPTNTSAGIYVNASSTINSNLRVTGDIDAPGSITNYFSAACGANNFINDIADNGTFSCAVPTDTSYPGQAGSLQALWTNTLAPTNTSAGLFVYASSTINSNLRVSGDLAMGGNIGIAADTDILAMTANQLTVNGEIYSTNDINASTNGATLAAPRVFGYTDLSSGESARFQFGDEHNALQNAYGQDVNLYSYWALVLTGGRQNYSSGFFAQPFSKNTNVGVLVKSDSYVSNDPGAVGTPIDTLGIMATTSQWTNLTSWRNKDGGRLSVVDNLGGFHIGTAVTTTDKLQVVGGSRIDSLNATTTNIDNLTVFTGTTLPANDIVTADIADGTILEIDLNVDEEPTNNDILTFDSTGNNFSWQTPAELGIADTSYPGQMGSWSTLWANTLAPTNTSAGFFSYASSTVNSNFRVSGDATITNSFSVSNLLLVDDDNDIFSIATTTPAEASLASKFRAQINSALIETTGIEAALRISASGHVNQNVNDTWVNFFNEYEGINWSIGNKDSDDSFTISEDKNLGSNVRLKITPGGDTTIYNNLNMDDGSITNYFSAACGAGQYISDISDDGTFVCSAPTGGAEGQSGAWQEIWTNTLAPTNTSAGIYITASSTIGADIGDSYIGVTGYNVFASSTVFANNLFSFGNATATNALHASQVCISNDCRTAWPVAGSGSSGSWQTLWPNTLAPTNTSAGFFSYASSTVNGNFRVSGNSTTTGTVVIGETPTANRPACFAFLATDGNYVYMYASSTSAVTAMGANGLVWSTIDCSGTNTTTILIGGRP